MKKLLLISLMLFATSCLSHKDLAQVRADSYERATALDDTLRTELFIQKELDNFFLVQFIDNGAPYVIVRDVRIIESLGNSKRGVTYKIDAVLSSSVKGKSYIRTNMTVEVIPYFRGIGQISAKISPW